MIEKFKDDLQFIKELMDKNGPDPEDYQKLNDWYDAIELNRASKKYTKEEIDYLRAQFGETYLTNKAIQGFIYTKPHGYPGDFEIIDKIYQKHVSSEDKFLKWDMWFHTLAAPKAVRNRKSYFKKLLNQLDSKNSAVEVLNLASGPCRDLAEFYEENPNATIKFDCVEIDKNAVEFAKKLLGINLQNVNFILANIFRYKPSIQYDLIWIAGLFNFFIILMIKYL